MNKPDTNSEIKAETITARQSLLVVSPYETIDRDFAEMENTPFQFWPSNRASFADPICNYCGQYGADCDC
jgi:hypothetical protein